MDQLPDPLRQILCNTQDSVTFKKETRTQGTGKSHDSNLGTKGPCYKSNRQNGYLGFTTLVTDGIAEMLQPFQWRPKQVCAPQTIRWSLPCGEGRSLRRSLAHHSIPSLPHQELQITSQATGWTQGWSRSSLAIRFWAHLGHATCPNNTEVWKLCWQPPPPPLTPHLPSLSFHTST